MSNGLVSVSDDVLLEMTSPTKPRSPDGLGVTDNQLMNATQEALENSIDTFTGAPFDVRAAVGAAQSQEDKLATLKKFYPDALPVEVLNPKYGASKFGRGNFVFTSPETGELTLFDEDLRVFGFPVPTTGDFADIGPEIAETVGGLATGALAATAAAGATSPTILGTIPAGTAAFVAGEGVGSAAFREGYISLLDYFGETEDSRTGLEQFGDAIVTGTLNAALGPVASKLVDGVKFVAGAPIRYATNSLSVPAKEALKKMQNVVSAPTVGAVLNTPFYQWIENSVLKSMPLSSRRMKENSEQTLRELDERAASLAQEYGGGAAKTYSETASGVMTAAQKAQQRYIEKRNAMYDEVGELMPKDLVGDTKHVERFKQKYLADSQSATGVDDIDPALRLVEKMEIDAKNGVLTYDRLKNFRSGIQRNIRSAETQGALSEKDQRIKELIGYITKDLDALVESGASKQLSLFDDKAGVAAAENILTKYKAANEFVAENMKKGGDMAFVEDIIREGGAEASNALTMVLRGSDLGAEKFEKLRRQFEPEEFDELVGFTLGRMGRGKMPGLEATEEAVEEGTDLLLKTRDFNPGRFLKSYEAMSPEARKVLFQGTRYKDLPKSLDDLLFTINRVTNAANQMGNPSGTARAMYAMGGLGVFGGLGQGGFAAAGGYDEGADGFNYGLGALLAPAFAAKLFTDPKFVKWMAEGVEKAAFNPNSFGQHVRRLVQISEFNPEIRDHVRAITAGMSQENLEPRLDEGSSSEQAKSKPEDDNELRFRQSVGAATADKVLPSREELMSRADSIDIPEIDADPFGGETIFEPLPEVAAASIGGAGMNSALSPTIVPSDQDRELAMRMQGGIGSIA
tara:strand:+ start:581 stop:3154 length:2574 start_codon:yes stop_codon:yes gene_type:complete